MKIVLIILTILSLKAFAIDSSFKSFTQNLNYESLEGAFLKDHESGRINRFGVSIGYSYIETALELKTTTGTTDAVFDLSKVNLGFHYTINNKMRVLVYSSWNQSAYFSDTAKDSSIGDTELALKYLMLKKDTWALALMPRLTFGTGDEDRQLGLNSTGYGLMLNLEKVFQSFSTLLNIGYQYSSDNIYQDIDEENTYQLGLGVRVPFHRFAIQSEYRANFNNESTSLAATELSLGASLKINSYLRAFASISSTDLEFSDSDKYRYFAGIKTNFGKVKNQERKADTVIVDKPQEQQKEVIEMVERETITFELGSSEVSDFFKGKITNFAQAYSENKSERMIMIEGHATSTGTRELNMKLSRKRAEKVSSLLVDAGIHQDKIKIEAYGEMTLKQKVVVIRFQEVD